jgi:hypothetical protein
MQPMSAALPTLQPPLPQTNMPQGGDRVFVDDAVAVTNAASGPYATTSITLGTGNIGNGSIDNTGAIFVVTAPFTADMVGGSVTLAGVALDPSNVGSFLITQFIGTNRIVVAGTHVAQNLDQEGITLQVNAPAICRFQMDIPSTKLHPSLTIGYVADNTSGQDNILPASGATAWTLKLDAWTMNKQGILVPGNTIVTNLPLPTTYEAVTGVRQWRGKITVPNAPGTGIAAGRLWLVARWEAASGAAMMSDAELARIFQACKLVVQGTQSSSTGV